MDSSKPDLVRAAAQQIAELCGQTDKLIDLMALAIKRRRRPRKGVISDNWSVRNQLLVYYRAYAEARGAKQWSEVGRFIRKGQRAVYILRPRMIWIDDPKTKEKNKKRRK